MNAFVCEQKPWLFRIVETFLQYIDLYYYGPEVGHVIICMSIHLSWHGSVEEYHFVASQRHLSDGNQLREQCRCATCSLF